MCQSTHIPSWPLSQVSGGMLPVFCSKMNFPLPRAAWRINHKDCWSKQPAHRHWRVFWWQELLDAPRQLPELLSHHASPSRCLWKPSGFASNIIKQSSSETCLLARDALSAWISSIPNFLRHVLVISPPKSLLILHSTSVMSLTSIISRVDE